MLAAAARARCTARLPATLRPAVARSYHPARVPRAAAEAETKAKDVFSDTLKQADNKTKAKQLWAIGRFAGLSTSTKKLNPVCHLIRGTPPSGPLSRCPSPAPPGTAGLSYNEAVAQLMFNPKRNAEVVRRCLDTVRYSAENNYNLNVDRLVVSTPSCPACLPALSCVPGADALRSGGVGRAAERAEKGVVPRPRPHRRGDPPLVLPAHRAARDAAGAGRGPAGPVGHGGQVQVDLAPPARPPLAPTCFLLPGQGRADGYVW